MNIPARQTALVCVDFQNDFCHENGFFAGAGHDVSPCAAAAEQAASTAAAARAAGVTIVLTRTVRTDASERQLRPTRHPGERSDAAPGTLGKPSYLPDAWGTQILPELLPYADLVVDKPRQSPFHRTDLERELRARDLAFVVVAGVTTNCCVDCTIRDAAVRDFDVLVLDDCVGAFGAERHLHDATLENASRFFGVVASTDAFLEALA
jgi:nicotinamidase-related amidase